MNFKMNPIENHNVRLEVLKSVTYNLDRIFSILKLQSYLSFDQHFQNKKIKKNSCRIWRTTNLYKKHDAIIGLVYWLGS